MSTGPEHYRAAEELLDIANDYDEDGAPVTAKARRDEALVRATLALGAATAMQAPVDGSEPGMSPREFGAWHRAAGSTPTPTAADYAPEAEA